MTGLACGAVQAVMFIVLQVACDAACIKLLLEPVADMAIGAGNGRVGAGQRKRRVRRMIKR